MLAGMFKTIGGHFEDFSGTFSRSTSIVTESTFLIGVLVTLQTAIAICQFGKPSSGDQLLTSLATLSGQPLV